MTSRDEYLKMYRREQATTLRVLRAFPQERLDLRPHPKSKTARELGWVFVLDARIASVVFQDRLPELLASGATPEPTGSWDELIAELERYQQSFIDLVSSTPESEIGGTVKFVTGPNQIGDIPRTDWLWFILHDQIHHRGQFSIYLRMADGKVPSIYGPTADEPWA